MHHLDRSFHSRGGPVRASEFEFTYKHSQSLPIPFKHESKLQLWKLLSSRIASDCVEFLRKRRQINLELASAWIGLKAIELNGSERVEPRNGKKILLWILNWLEFWEKTASVCAVQFFRFSKPSKVVEVNSELDHHHHHLELWKWKIFKLSSNESQPSLSLFLFFRSLTIRPPTDFSSQTSCNCKRRSTSTWKSFI